jgi:RNA polymerase sigma factor (sigma-70 family)
MRAAAEFPTTRWTLLLSAGGDPDAESARALASLCEKYWYPIYAYIRRRKRSADEAQDLTQEFFALVLEKRYFERADQNKGRFRSFLLSSLTYFLCDEADRRHALKRGGNGPPLPFEIASGEDLYQREPWHDETPERIFERRWALGVLDCVLSRLRDEVAHGGQARHFDRLKVFLLEAGDIPYAALAAELETSQGALRVAIHRLRKRYREVFLAEIAETVALPGQIEGEIRHLLDALRPA